MTRRLRVAGLLVAGGAVGGTARAEWPRHLARPPLLPGVPYYDYRPVTTPRPTVTAMSLVKVTVANGTTGVPPAVGATAFAADAVRPGPRAQQLYQLLEPRLQADHCFLSRVAVAFHDDGSFQISFRADQNPQPGTDLRSPLRPGERLDTTLQTSQLKRNLFVVKVRGYASYPVAPTRLVAGVTPPALVEFPIEPFWVHKGEPFSGFVTGRSEDVRRYFSTIDRIEVEFTYR
jgi:hypothetical protein